MENEKDLEKSNEEVETSENNEVEETEDNTEVESDDSIPTVGDYEALKKKNKELYERAKKAEAQAKQLKAAPKEAETNKSNAEPTLSREEIVLLAKGVPDEDVEFLKTLQAGSKALGKDISLIEAMNNPAYLALKKDREAQEKKSKAQLGASGGSPSQKNIRDAVNMSEDEHRKLFEQYSK